MSKDATPIVGNLNSRPRSSADRTDSGAANWNTDAWQQLAGNDDRSVWIGLAADAIERTFSGKVQFCTFEDDGNDTVQFVATHDSNYEVFTAALEIHELPIAHT